MITNPTIGMRVRFADPTWTNFYGRAGTLKNHGMFGYYEVLFDHSIDGYRDWVFNIRRLEPLQSSLDKQEQKRREEHASRYL